MDTITPKPAIYRKNPLDFFVKCGIIKMVRNSEHKYIRGVQKYEFIC